MNKTSPTSTKGVRQSNEFACPHCLCCFPGPEDLLEHWPECRQGSERSHGYLNAAEEAEEAKYSTGNCSNHLESSAHGKRGDSTADTSGDSSEDIPGDPTPRNDAALVTTPSTLDLALQRSSADFLNFIQSWSVFEWAIRSRVFMLATRLRDGAKRSLVRLFTVPFFLVVCPQAGPMGGLNRVGGVFVRLRTLLVFVPRSAAAAAAGAGLRGCGGAGRGSGGRTGGSGEGRGGADGGRSEPRPRRRARVRGGKRGPCC